MVSPVALETVTRIDAIFDFERAINGPGAAVRLASRQTDVAPQVTEFGT